MAHDVFISYSAEDRAVADAMCSTLEADGVRCWMAPRDIMPGADWGGSIIDAIASSRVMVLVLSSNSNASSQVKREVERAVNKEVVVIPFRIEDVSLSKSLEYQLSLTHWMDALTPPIEVHLQTLAGKIRQLLDADSVAEDSPVRTAKGIPVQPLPPSNSKRTTLYLGAGLAVALVAVAGLILWRVMSPSTPETGATVSALTSTPSPSSTPAHASASATPAADAPSAAGTPKAEPAGGQSQSANGGAAADAGGRANVPVVAGKSYDVARKILMKAGWQPHERHWSHGDDPEVQSGNGPVFWKRGYRELEVCSGSSLAECRFEFIDPSERILVVVTEGEEDEGGQYHATVKQATLKRK
jgi:hypothetical protein